jgi:hypothetical protein
VVLFPFSRLVACCIVHNSPGGSFKNLSCVVLSPPFYFCLAHFVYCRSSSPVCPVDYLRLSAPLILFACLPCCFSLPVCPVDSLFACLPC